MSAAVLPLPEPPADDVVELQALLAAARGQHGIATERLSRCIAWAADRPLDAVEMQHLRVMVSTRIHEATLWADVIAGLVSKLRALGIEP